MNISRFQLQIVLAKLETLCLVVTTWLLSPYYINLKLYNDSTCWNHVAHIQLICYPKFLFFRNFWNILFPWLDIHFTNTLNYLPLIFNITGLVLSFCSSKKTSLLDLSDGPSYNRKSLFSCSVASDSWRVLGVAGISVKGNTYWVATRRSDVDFLLIFDFSTELFQSQSFPHPFP